MNTSATRWLSRLQLSPRSQRVLTEAALDWQHEVATAKTTTARIASHARATAAFLRAIVFLSARSIADVVIHGWAIRFVMWVVVVSVVTTLPDLVGPSGGPFSPLSRATQFLAASTVGSAWMAVFYCVLTAKSGEAVPRVGLTVLAVLTVFATASWLFPWAVEKAARWSNVDIHPGSAYPPGQYALHFAYIVASLFIAGAMRAQSAPSRWHLAFPAALLALWWVPMLLSHVVEARAPRFVEQGVPLTMMAIYWLVLVRRLERAEPSEMHPNPQ
jgi:hypothetical protein